LKASPFGAALVAVCDVVGEKLVSDAITCFTPAQAAVNAARVGAKAALRQALLPMGGLRVKGLDLTLLGCA